LAQFSNPDQAANNVAYCTYDLELSLEMNSWIEWFKNIEVFYGISYISSIIGNILSALAKQNVKLDMGTLVFEALMVISAFLF
jgi:hypothetical protein